MLSIIQLVYQSVASTADVRPWVPRRVEGGPEFDTHYSFVY